MTALLEALGGTSSGEHGDGRLRAPIIQRLYGPDVVDLFRQVKRAFDPAGIMNPGVKVPEDGARPVAHLKVGPDAVAIPQDIEDRLRQLEQTGGWSTPKLDLVDQISEIHGHPS